MSNNKKRCIVFFTGKRKLFGFLPIYYRIFGYSTWDLVDHPKNSKDLDSLCETLQGQCKDLKKVIVTNYKEVES